MPDNLENTESLKEVAEIVREAIEEESDIFEQDSAEMIPRRDDTNDDGDNQKEIGEKIRSGNEIPGPNTYAPKNITQSWQQTSEPRHNKDSGRDKIEAKEKRNKHKNGRTKKH